MTQAERDEIYEQARKIDNLEAALDRILELYIQWNEHGFAYDDILAEIKETASGALK